MLAATELYEGSVQPAVPNQGSRRMGSKARDQNIKSGYVLESD